jgi:2-haloacid dehalogenase
MTADALKEVRACVFDAYGTLFDHASAAARCGDVPADKRDRLAALWREKQLQYSWLRSLEGRHADFWQVTADALDYTLDALALPAEPLRGRLMELYLTLDAFPEVAGVLRRVRAGGMKTAILSNGTPAMLAAAVERAGIGADLDAVLSVEDVGVFKTHPKVYQLALDRLRVAARDVVFVSSNGWDAYAASAFGMRVVWCNRYGQRGERLPGKPDREIRTLADLSALVGAGA